MYVGDTIEKDLVKNVEKLKELGFEITLHDKMPDVVLYREDKDWIYFVESVTSVGPMDPKRILEIEEMTKDVTAGKIFVTAFLDFKTYKRFAEELAWETEVWIAEMPEHIDVYKRQIVGGGLDLVETKVIADRAYKWFMTGDFSVKGESNDDVIDIDKYNEDVYKRQIIRIQYLCGL